MMHAWREMRLKLMKINANVMKVAAAECPACREPGSQGARKG